MSSSIGFDLSAICEEGTACPMPSTTKEPSYLDKTLPAEWFRSEQIFELQKRAIFTSSWILVSHSLRFEKPGDYISSDYAGLPYIILWTRDGEFKAFHNSCRHRAFPLVQKEKGNASLFACMYHSWSYRQDGSLIKAPKFDSVPGFNKEENGLFPIHIHVTDKGFIFINFEADTPIPFYKFYGSLPLEWKHLPSKEYEYCFSWTKTVSANVMLSLDAYNECYHCQVGHPGFAKTLDLPKYEVIPFTNFARHEVPLKGGQSQNEEEKKQPPTFTYCYPTCGATTTPQGFYMMKNVPISAARTRIDYDVYKRKTMPYDEFREWFTFYEQVEKEDWDL